MGTSWEMLGTDSAGKEDRICMEVEALPDVPAPETRRKIAAM